MSIPYLDCSYEVCTLRQPQSDRMVWLARDIEQRDFLVILTDEAQAELERLAAYLVDSPLPILQRRLDEFDLPACRALMQQMKAILDDGDGFALLGRLPMDDYPIDTLVEIYWLLGQHVGRPVAQK